jgi:hypothetical protein
MVNVVRVVVMLAHVEPIPCEKPEAVDERLRDSPSPTPEHVSGIQQSVTVIKKKSVVCSIGQNTLA